MSEAHMDDAQQEKKPKKTWDEFVNGSLVELFYANKLKTLTAEDENGNKAKLTIKMIEKQEALKVELSSTQYH